MKNKIILFGSTGQLGSFIKKKISKNFLIICYNSNNGNILKKNLIKKILYKHKPQIVINAAALTNVDLCEKKKISCYNINAKSLKNLSKLCLELKILLIHFSTDYIFNSKKKIFFSESSRSRPINYYGKCKLLAEKYIKDSGCYYLILRISWLFSNERNNFLTFFLDKIKNYKKISLVNSFGSPTSTRLVVKTLNLLLERNSLKYKKIFHLSCRGSASWRKVFLYILNHTKINKQKISYKVIDKIYQWKAERPLCSQLSCKKIEKFLNIKIPHWKDELNYYLNNR